MTTRTTDPSSFWWDPEHGSGDFGPLQEASQDILQALRRDEASPHADLYRRILSTTSTSAAGSSNSNSNNNNNGGEILVNHAYLVRQNNHRETTNHHNSSSSSSSPHWKHVQSIPLPQVLQDLLSTTQMKVSHFMGLWDAPPPPQGDDTTTTTNIPTMAWMTLDDTLYIWSINITTTTPSSSIHGSDTSSTATTTNNFLVSYQVPTNQPIVSVGLAPPKAGT